MEFLTTEFSDLFVVENLKFIDTRGEFIKTFNNDNFVLNGISFDIKESYYSLSKKGVLRGMHFQTPPYDHQKLVYVIKGKILDVVLDLRKNSPNFGKYFHIELSEDNNKALFIPAGFAHGFYSMEEDSIVVYNQTTCYNKESDSGIRYDSFGFTWPQMDPIMSERDKIFPAFGDFQTPFM